ncbi:hypothetical protein, partial [Klebsiella pneumoniae]
MAIIPIAKRMVAAKLVLLASAAISSGPAFAQNAISPDGEKPAAANSAAAELAPRPAAAAARTTGFAAGGATSDPEFQDALQSLYPA